MSEGEVLVIVFLEIQSFRFCRNALAGIVLKFPAGLFCGYNTLFDTEDLVILDGCAKFAVCAVMLDVFPKQHRNYLDPFFFVIIHPGALKSYCDFEKIFLLSIE